MLSQICFGTVSALYETVTSLVSDGETEQMQATQNIGGDECDELQPVMAMSSGGSEFVNTSDIYLASTHGQSANGSYTLPAGIPVFLPGGGSYQRNYTISWSFSGGRVSSWTHYSNHNGHTNPHTHSFGYQSNGWWGPNNPCGG